MNQLDRKAPPIYRNIEKIDYTKAEKKLLKNDISLFSINVGTQDLVKIDFIFEAGEWFQHKPLVASTTISMLCEGSIRHTAEEIAEKLDFMGSFVYFNAHKHYSLITVYTLTKYADDTISLLEEIIKYPTFPQNELDIHLKKKKQQYIIESQKIEVMAQKKFSNVIFGDTHTYGLSAEPSDFDYITVNDLKDFHKNHYSHNNCKIVIAGKCDDSIIDTITKYFGDNQWGGPELLQPTKTIISGATVKQHFVEREGSVQSALRVGKLMINKKHEDFPGLQVLNTIFGGYFGSRLMSNIRETKGYTYGIGSGLISYRNGGYFVIVSEVGKPVTRLALDEIYKELKILRLEPINLEELNTVKNYMLGSILRNFDGAFALSDSLRSILEYDLEYEYFDNFIKTVKTINQERIINLANTYLHEDTMYEVVAG